ncbi:MAG: ABC transporter ATP-binding protein [Synechococcales bacterium]|nr:ABC transporter ATP-binding protein [Synechococcales bacterium]
MSEIRFEQVSLQFPGAPRPVVKQFSFTVQSGQILVILGPSGCGKTTVLKLVNRLYEPTIGKVYLNQMDISQMPVTRLRQQIGYVIQQVGLFPHMTVAQNIAVVPKLLGWSRGKIQQQVEMLLTLVDLPVSDFRDRYPLQLSGGQQQRVGLARALAGNPDVILMDEPFAALDAITRSNLQEEILRLQRHFGKTILFVSHDIEEALRLADQMIIMQNGCLIQTGKPFDILSRPTNAFVRDLVSADDILRQLSLLRVETFMAPIPVNPSLNSSLSQTLSQTTIPSQHNLRQALSLLLGKGESQLTVVQAGEIVGVLSLNQIRDLACRMGAAL